MDRKVKNARTAFLLCQMMLFLAVAVIGKVGFLIYNQGWTECTAADMPGILLSGLCLDISVVFAVLLPVWIYLVFTCRSNNVRLLKHVGPYLQAVMFLTVLITLGDAIMYAHWKFKLDASIFGYMFSPGEVGASVPTSYIISRFSALVISVLVTSVLCRRLTPRRITAVATKTDITVLMSFPLVCIALALPAPCNGEAAAFRSGRIMLNHAAINPVRHFAVSSYLYCKPLDSQFRNMQEAECDSIFAEIFPSVTEDIQDTLLKTPRPNIMTIQLEGCGAYMIESLGGRRDVTPELCRWMERGVNFDNAWATSFRTDRGTVSALSGYVSYPTASLMLNDSCICKLPSLARTLKGAGYSAEYLYGGDPDVMNKKVYLRAMGFDPVYGVEDINVPLSERDSWGANDSISLARLLSMALSKPKDKPWYIGYQTISSHEPWLVPYDRLDDPVLNAFAYTDHCLGMFLDSLSHTPVWDNLLVIVFADHGITYGLDMSDPEFFHMPLLMVGGAVRGPRKFPVLISQADIAATVLGQMGIAHTDFPWSRNVFSRNYTCPFIYCTYPSGILFKDATGTTMTDLFSGRVVNGGDGHEDRLRRIDAMLQTTYCRIP